MGFQAISCCLPLLFSVIIDVEYVLSAIFFSPEKLHQKALEVNDFRYCPWAMGSFGCGWLFGLLLKHMKGVLHL